MSDSWDEYADSWDSNTDVIAYADKAFASLCQVCELQGLRVLDFGCGTGLLSEKIAAKAESVLAIDSSQKMIEVLKQKKLSNVQSFACEVSNELIKTEPVFTPGFDLIVASSVCAFLPDFEETLSCLHALLKDGGSFVQWDWKKQSEQDEFGFSENMIRSAYLNLGLSPVSITDAFSLSSDKGKGKGKGTDTMHVLMGIAKKD